MHPTRFKLVEGTVYRDYHIFIDVNLSWNLEGMPCINQPRKNVPQADKFHSRTHFK